MSKISISNKKILTVIILAFVIILVFSSWFINEYKQIANQAEISLEQIKEIGKRAQGLIENSGSQFKTYRNEEYGFEFQYPGDLIVRENAFNNYYSKFNLEILTKIGEQFDKTFLVNIVLPEFTERSFEGLDKTVTKVNIDGISGIQYQYEFNNRQEKVIILPFNKQYKLILGVYYKEYNDIFNQIISTFKFIK